MVICALLAPAGGTALAGSGNLSTTAGASRAQLLTPITLTHTAGRSLQFGAFTAGSGGTVVIATNGTGTTTAGVTFMPTHTTAADAFRVRGQPNTTFAITTGIGTVTSGANSMSFTTTPSLATSTLSGGGARNFTVGGTITVPASIQPGSYAGSYPVTVAYN